MAVNQRDVYLLPFPSSLDNTYKTPAHLFIVLSIKEANEYENTFIGVMITSTDNPDEHSFLLNDSMFEQPLAKPGSHVRMHLMTLFVNEDIDRKRINVMREFFFKELMKTLGETIFNYNFEKLK